MGNRERVVFSEQHSGGARSAVFMVRRNGHKYVRYMEDGYAPQLFDLANDPLERADLAEDPAHAGLVADCEAALREVLDPEATDAKAKDDQSERIERGGGQEAIVAQGSLGYTPAPGEEPKYMQ